MTSCPEGCGACCDPVTLYWDPIERAVTYLDDCLPDPDTAAGWAWWQNTDFSPGVRVSHREEAHALYAQDPVHPSIANMRFIREHWTVVDVTEHPTAGTYWSMRCDAFDPDARTCTAYEDRPPICSQYPWYGREPERPASVLPNVCAFQDDVPGRKVLPIIEVRQGVRT